jgi:DNA-directed RNA polymerase II subunit RPB2
MNNNDFIWKTIDTMFKDNKNFLVKHHLESYNYFFKEGLINIFKDKNPLKFFKEKMDKPREEEFKYQFKMYFGGKNADKIYYGKPVIYDNNGNEEREHYMYPNEARLRNMTYGFTIHYDVVVDYTIHLNGEREPHTDTYVIEKVFLGKFPIMINSNYCLLKELDPEVRFNMGECRNDIGGYFIIDGKEKAIMPQEGRADNVLYIKENNINDVYSHSAEIKSVSEDASKPNRTLSVRIVRETPSQTNGHIVVNIPQVRAPIPLFILMRALGVISDKEIIETCLLEEIGTNKIIKNESYIELFRPSIHDAGLIFNQYSALKYIKELLKYKSNDAVLEILMLYFLPHIGELNFKHKAYYIGYMVKRLLDVSTGNQNPTDRDSYSYKRIETSGVLLYKLFQEYYNKQFSHINRIMDKEFFYKGSKSGANIYAEKKFKNLIATNQKLIFVGDGKHTSRIVEQGFRKAFKGDWGSDIHTKRAGIVQDLDRLSFFATLCQLRKTNLHISADGAKIRGPRFINSTQYGLICPLHSPSGGNCGLHKHLSTSTYITRGSSAIPFFKYIKNISKIDKGQKEYIKVKLIEECNLLQFTHYTKIFINGCWFALTDTPNLLCELIRSHKRNNIIDQFTSIYFNIKLNEILISTDAGRLCRPLFYKGVRGPKGEQGIWSHKRDFKDNLTWFNYIKGFKNDENEYFKTEKTRQQLVNNGAIVEFIDAFEGEGIMMGHSSKNIETFNENITNMEIHPSLILGIMANQIIFPEHNQYPRNAFACGQAKQGVSVFHSNYRNRIDKTALFLNYGQNPLTKSKYFKYACNDEHPYGENTIVAIMCYTGFNVEDAVILNKGSIDRGLFSTTKYAVYETYEETVMLGGGDKNTRIMNVYDPKQNVTGFKSGYDYSKLDDNGLIREGEIIDEKTILIGKAILPMDSEEAKTDDSVKPKKAETGIIDKAFITEGREGTRIAKIRIRSIRMPELGDKFCSRAGQKGTIGLILKEADMPTSATGLKPDIIVNPHAMPSRMTIGHIVETITSKLAAIYGGFGDCTAFTNKGPQQEIYGKYLLDAGMEKYGQEFLYNGMTGEQLETEIYIGPTYYLRLKHMPKDKINYRARGPRDQLTRQTVGGRANDGGLRLGEMDRDCVVAHGLSHFVTETLMKRGDEFQVAICNQTGCIAAYNPRKNIFLSPFADGPIKFENTVGKSLNVININKFGRSFSIVNIPYAFKLLLQELQGMNIQMRIITEDNIDQLMSLGNGGVTEIRNLTHNKNANYDTIKKETINTQTRNNIEFDRHEFLKYNPVVEETVVPTIVSSMQDWNMPTYPHTMPLNLYDDDDPWGTPGTSMMQYPSMPSSGQSSGWDQAMQQGPSSGAVESKWEQDKPEPQMGDIVDYMGTSEEERGHITRIDYNENDPLDSSMYEITKMDGTQTYKWKSDFLDYRHDSNYIPPSDDEESEEDFDEKPPLIIDKDDADIKKDITLLNVEEGEKEEEEEESAKKSITIDNN